MNLARVAIRRPLGTLLLAVAVSALGLMAFQEMRVGLMPRIVYPLIKVRVAWAGTPPDVMELLVTRPLEQELARTDGAVLIQSTTEQGMTDITLSFDYGSDVDLALRDATTRLDFARGRLPEGVPPPLIWKLDPADMPVLQVALGSANADEVELRRWAEYDLAPQLIGVPGVAAALVVGGQEREIRVEADLIRLSGHDLTLTDVADALANENRQESAGRLDQGGLEWLTRTAGGFASVAAIEKVGLPVGAGRSIELGDVATVVDSTREQRLFVRYNGESAVLLSVFQNPTANTVETAEGVRRRLRALRERGFIPPDVSFGVVSDESVYIRDAIASLQEHLLEGTALAVVVLFLFLGNVRATFCVVAVFPVALLGTAAAMRYGGLTLNLMSLGGMIVGLGVMIDSAIVTMENIDRLRREGLSPAAAGETAARQVTGSLVAATLAMLVSVIPFLAISNLALLFYREMILTIAISFALALVASLTVVPALATALDRRPARPSRFWAAAERAYARLARCLGVAPAAFLGVAVATAAGAILFESMGSVFLPEVDDGRVDVRVILPPGRSLAENVRASRRVEEVLRGMPHVEGVLATIGGRVSTAVSYDAAQTELSVRLVPRSERSVGVEQWIADARDRLARTPLPEGRVRVEKGRIRSIRTFQGGVGREGVTDLQLNLQGQNPAALNAVADQVVAALSDVPGLEGVASTVPPRRTELSFEPDAARAAALGVEAESVAKHLKIALAGEVPTRYLDAPFFHDVRLWADRDQLADGPDVLDVLRIPARDGGSVPLASVAEVVRRGVPIFVERENQSPLVQITGAVTGDRTLGEASADVRRRLAEIELPPGVQVGFGGKVATLEESQAPLIGALLLAVFLRLIVLGVQFESLLNPALVTLTVLPALAGSLVALDLAGVPVSSTVYVGLLLAAGIVESNSILLVEFVEQARRSGGSLRDAILEAAPQRLRPILLTAATSLVALVPLAAARGEGSEMLRPVALAVIGGLLVATLFTLLFLPSMYLLSHGLRDRLVRRFQRTDETPTRDEATPGRIAVGAEA